MDFWGVTDKMAIPNWSGTSENLCMSSLWFTLILGLINSPNQLNKSI